MDPLSEQGGFRDDLIALQDRARRALVSSWALARHPVLSGVSGLRVTYAPFIMPAQAADLFIGWGRKRSGRLAVRRAEKAGVPAILLEDGFLRSAGREDSAISIVYDDAGIYYDASLPSRLEKLILAPMSADRIRRARELRAAWVTEEVSKYNAGREPRSYPADPYVLVVDQVAGDTSISSGLADTTSFERMLEAALKENPQCRVVVKTHPDGAVRSRSGHFRIKELEGHERVSVIADPCHPVGLIKRARKVYTVTSQVGFEALLHGRPVRCFGMPFYAGWGLTDDEMPAPARRGHASLEALIHASLIDYAIYFDPLSSSVITAEQAIAQMGSVRRLVQKTPEIIYAVGFSSWKRNILRRFCRFSQVYFRRADEVPAGEKTVAVWGARQYEDLPDCARIIRIEDGFLRSRGLGADLVQPISWCLDIEGMHFDCSQSSEIETMLLRGEISESHLARARGLRLSIASLGVSKYNLSGSAWAAPKGKRVVLVAGQVEDDASIRSGSPKVQRNIDLLRAARQAEPEAWLVYKPHPDVVSGLRCADSEAEAIREIADEVASDVSLEDLFSQIDAVHVMTSQIGFEALIRGVSVTCHGLPFYAGWGLTDDLLQSQRRGRVVSIDALVAAALILYPSYSDPRSGQVITPEQAIALLTRKPGRVRGRPLLGRARRFWLGLRKRGGK